MARVVLNHRTQRFRLVDENGRTVGYADEVSLVHDGRGRAHRGVAYNRAGKPVVVATVSTHD